MSFKMKNNFNFNGFEDKLKFAIEIYGVSVSQKLEADAKSNFKWTPRTGRAHQSLFGEANWKNNKVLQISLSHGVDYGIGLEFANEKKYAIIKPTIDSNKNDVISGLKGLLD